MPAQRAGPPPPEGESGAEVGKGPATVTGAELSPGHFQFPVFSQLHPAPTSMGTPPKIHSERHEPPPPTSPTPPPKGH